MSSVPPENPPSTWPAAQPPPPGAGPEASTSQAAGAAGGSRTPWIIGIAAAVAAGILLAACGGDDGSSGIGDAGGDDESPASTTEATTATTEAGPDDSEAILAAANAAYTAFADADCDTLDGLLTADAVLPTDCELVEQSLGIEMEFTDVAVVSQTEDEAFVDHTLHLTDQTGTEALQGTSRLVKQDGEWLIADFNGSGSQGSGSGGSGGGPPPEAPPLGDPTPPPTGGASSFNDELAQNCHDGNMVDCDWLYENMGEIWLPDDQPHMDYGSTCGGRVAEPANGMCTDWYGSTL